MSLLSRLAVQAARAYGILSSNPNNVSADYLVVAGGGGGGSGRGGGGGAGGMLTATTNLSILNTYSITVGAGGIAGTPAPSTAKGGNGNNSSIIGTGTSITSTGGGGGDSNGIGTGGNSGGSGGGGAVWSSGGAGTSGQGNAGGLGGYIGRFGTGGGGGAGTVGADATPSGTTSGAGGSGTASSISGSSVTYAGGGGGGNDSNATAGAGGSGGGGAGSVSGAGTAGTTNLGGGGGGGGRNAGTGAESAGGAGGSGIVIISYASATPKFVGGTITTSGGNQIHTFTSSGTLSPITPITASYLVVAGGGAGGALKNGAIVGGGGGGAGGLLTSSTTLYSGATYVVTVGAGGAGVSAGTSGSGSNSIVSGTGLTTITATGGGGGGWNDNSSGIAGGSGGGGANGSSGGAGTSGQGNNGGGSSSSGGSGGGGGAGAVGASSSNTVGANGGAGTASSITGTSVTYAGGGGGGGYNAAAGLGGAGGGGDAGAANTTGSSGTSNLGGGGGGCGGSSTATAKAGGNGGSGIVIISYAGSQQFNGGLVTTSGGNTIHTFLATGALTPLTNNLNNSLRFRRSASAYLNRTFSTPTNNKIWTYSAWVKRGALGTGTGQTLMGYGVSGTLDSIGFNSSEQLSYFSVDSGGVTQRANYNTLAVFRDPSAWYHIVVAVDTTQATAGNRFKLYVNGNQQTVTTTTALAQNWNTYINSALNQGIGWQFDGTTNYFDGYMDDINFIDGQALEPYFFGNNDANGVWKPIQYRGTYGINGFYLNFSNTTSTTTLGFDSSPNGNNWTCNNISLTAGATYDAMTDVPTNTSATQGNYCTLNPTIRILSGSITEGNLRGAGSDFECWGTMAFPSTGKFYFEYTQNGSTGAGAGPGTGIQGINPPDVDFGVHYHRDGRKWVNGTYSSYGATFTTNDIIGVAYDADSNSITFYKNNVSQGAISTTSGYTYLPYQFDNSGNGGFLNFGQRPFAYTPPTGFVALNTFNLPTPTILQGNRYMDATLWTGNGPASQVIVNQGQFKPDMVWVKNRSSTRKHNIYDSVRGVAVGASYRLVPNLTSAEDNPAYGVTSMNSNGFTIGEEGDVNANGLTFVGWQWQAGQGSTSSNTAGSITSTVSVNTTAGFSIVTYTGNGVNGATVGHGLGVAPSMIIIKNRSATADWVVGTNPTVGAFPYTRELYLNKTDSYAFGNSFNNLAPTSSVFSIGSSATSNTNTNTYVAYCWAEIAGFSRFGSYTGNGSADGSFIFTGFLPKFIMIKCTDTAGTAWVTYDTSRDTYNQMTNILLPNASNAELSGYSLDVLANGFKHRQGGGDPNATGRNYIYAAFASNPFKNSNAR